MQSEYKIEQLAENLWSISEGIVQCFLVAGSKRALLIDSCISKGNALSDLVRKLVNTPIDLTFTHTDGDHTGGQDGFDAPLLHPSEYDYYYRDENNRAREVKPLWDGAILNLGDALSDASLEVLLIPGHTPGSLAFLDRNNRRLFVGDSVSDRWIYMFAQGRNLNAFIESLKKLEKRVGDFDRIHPCHGSPELDADWIARTRVAAEKLRDGSLVGQNPPQKLPCKAYAHEGVTLLY